MRVELTHEVRGLQLQVSGPQGGAPGPCSILARWVSILASPVR